jgi:fumarate hydratase subunit beta
MGEWVSLSGPLVTARDSALRRMMETHAEGKIPPVDLKGQAIYFVGPTPAAPGEAVGAAGPTTSRRMEIYLPMLITAGVTAIMGKGPLSAQAIAELQRAGVIYLAAIGGAGAYYGGKIKGAGTVAYEDLGPEAMYGMTVASMPAVVALDLQGNNLFEQGPEGYRRQT